jgi:hypothetical protein
VFVSVALEARMAEEVAGRVQDAINATVGGLLVLEGPLIAHGGPRAVAELGAGIARSHEVQSRKVADRAAAATAPTSTIELGDPHGFETTS